MNEHKVRNTVIVSLLLFIVIFVHYFYDINNSKILQSVLEYEYNICDYGNVQQVPLCIKSKILSIRKRNERSIGVL